jgi:hypothetical protein
VVEVLGGSKESQDVHRFIHHSSSIKLTRALPPIQQVDPSYWSGPVASASLNAFGHPSEAATADINPLETTNTIASSALVC